MTKTRMTGAEVRAARESYGVSRREFTEMAGFAAGARLQNIELKDSWKEGDRERVARVLAELEANPPTGRHGRRRGETGEARVDRLEGGLRANGALAREQGPTIWNPFIDQQPPLPGLDDWTPDLDMTAGGELPGEGRTPGDDEIVTFSQLVAPGEGLVDPATGKSHLTPAPRLISNSEVTTWERCRRRWWLGWYRRLILGAQDLTDKRATGSR